jgi:hypothetical protein
MAQEQEGKLFEHCTFAFVLNRDLPRTLAADVGSPSLPLEFLQLTIKKDSTYAGESRRNSLTYW